MIMGVTEEEFKTLLEKVLREKLSSVFSLQLDEMKKSIRAIRAGVDSIVTTDPAGCRPREIPRGTLFHSVSKPIREGDNYF